MKKHKVEKLVWLGAAILTIPNNTWDEDGSFLFQAFGRPLFLSNVGEDLKVTESVLDGEDKVGWVGIRPPMLTNNPPTHNVVYCKDVHSLKGGNRQVTRADLAKFMLMLADEKDKHNKEYLYLESR